MAIFTNQASLSYNGTTVNSNVVSGELVQVLTAEKTALGGAYRQGGIVSYVVNLRNTGAVALTGLTLTDDLGSYAFTPAAGGTLTLTPLTYVADSLRYFTDGTEQPAPVVTIGANAITVTGLSVPAGGVATVAYQTRANRFADAGTEGTIVNTVTIGDGGLAEAVTATETVEAADTAELTITKSLTPTQVSDNGTLTYTFLLENSGNQAAEAAAGIVLTDTFEPILRNITVEVNGAAWPAANYSYNEATGVFTTTAGALTVPAATVAQNAATGEWTVTGGVTTLRISGTV